jgi:N-dimethylarginine dimethylaminohydrolase
MTAVSSYNDFDRLEEIILGSAAHLHMPPVDTSFAHFFQPSPGYEKERISPAQLQRVAEETEQDMAELAHVLESFGVTVRRPDPVSHGDPVLLPGWSARTMFSLMPRDCLMVVGSTIIEAAMPSRPRYCETFGFRRLLREYFEGGANWLAAPRPRLADSTYQYSGGEPVLAEDEPLFDAANVIRCGADIFFNVSNTGNRLAALWLARVLGPQFAVHEMSICDDHVGTTLQVLRPGLLLANAERLRPGDIPAPLRPWKTLWLDSPADDGYGFGWPRASVWVGMNVLSIDHDTIIVPGNQVTLRKMLEAEGFQVVPAQFRHGRTLGGGFHCCSLDVRRSGSLERYV